MTGFIIAAVIVIVVLIVIVRNIKIVPQAHAYVIERLGAYKATWETGFHLKVPFIDKIAKKLSLTVGTFVMIYNIVLYMAVGVILNSWVLPLYSIVTYAAALKTVDFIVEGIDKCKAAVIITTKPQEISRALSETFGSGITLIPAKGYYSDQDKTVIYFVVNRFQISRMKRVVLENDKEAFISITETADAFGSNSKAEKNKI